VRSSLARGSLTGALQVIITTALVLVAVPMFVRLRGTEAFGVFSLIALVGNVNTFANLGLNAALVRFLSEQGKGRDSDLDVIVTVLILLGVILPLTVVAFLYEDLALKYVLNVPPAFMHDALWLYRGMLVSNVLVLIGGTCTAVLDACERVHVTNTLQILYTVTYWGSILAVLVAGWPLAAIGGATVGATLIWFIAAVIGMVRVWGLPSTDGLRERGPSRARKQIGYGAQLFSAGIIGFFYEPLTKLLLAHFLGVREVGFFDIGMRARNLVSSLALKALYPLYPLFSRLDDMRRIRFLVFDIQEKSLLLSAPIPGLLMLTTGPLVGLIFGAGNETITATIIWMISSYILWSFTVLPIYVFLMARGHAAKTIVVQIVNVVVNGITFVALFNWLGYGAVLAGITLSTLASWVLLLFYQSRLEMAVLFASWRPGLVFLGILLLGIVLGVVTPALTGSAIGVGVAGALLCVCTLFCYRAGKVFVLEDVQRYMGAGSRFARIAGAILVRDAGAHPAAGGA
jgi:O-antigen/teichoic acid export membrane protein